jgi:nicotinate-nucleotide pyrophosphorylase (carboxylating)
LLLDVEVRSEAEADEAIAAGADIVMLDNIQGDELVSVVRRLKEKWNGKRKFMFEASGNITEENFSERALNGMTICVVECQSDVDHFFPSDIDILSTSAVHQSVPHIDFSLKIRMP